MWYIKWHLNITNLKEKRGKLSVLIQHSLPEQWGCNIKTKRLSEHLSSLHWLTITGQASLQLIYSVTEYRLREPSVHYAWPPSPLKCLQNMYEEGSHVLYLRGLGPGRVNTQLCLTSCYSDFVSELCISVSMLKIGWILEFRKEF